MNTSFIEVREDGILIFKVCDDGTVTGLNDRFIGTLNKEEIELMKKVMFPYLPKEKK